MKKLFLTLAIMTISLNSFSNIEIIAKKLPVEFELIIQKLNSDKLTVDEHNKLVIDLQFINQDLAGFPFLNRNFLIKSEIYRLLLNNQHIHKDVPIQISQNLIEKMNKKRASSKKLSPTGHWVIRAIIADLESFNPKVFLKNKSRTNHKDAIEFIRYNKTIKYLGGWIRIFLESDSEKLEETLKNICLDIIHSIAIKASYIKNFAKRGKAKPLLNIPPLRKEKEVKNISEDQNSMALEAKKRKDEALEVVNKLEADDLSGVSDEIDKIQE